jgi:hypothetical protein
VDLAAETPPLVTGSETTEIEDRGLGITPEELDHLNVRLANPPEFGPLLRPYTLTRGEMGVDRT